MSISGIWMTTSTGIDRPLFRMEGALPYPCSWLLWPVSGVGRPGSVAVALVSPTNGMVRCHFATEDSKMFGSILKCGLAKKKEEIRFWLPDPPHE